MPSFLRRTLLATALAAGALALLSFLSVETGSPPGESSRAPVRVAEVVRDRPVQRVTVNGVTRARQRARLAFQVTGELIARPVAIGDRVSAGQRLAELDNPSLQPTLAGAEARVAELRARLSQRERDLARTRRLRADDAVSEDELEAIAADRDALAAALDNALSELARARRAHRAATLTAPFDATVAAVLAEPGEHVRAGEPVLRLGGEGGLEVEVEVPESAYHALTTGARARAVLPFLGDLEVDARVLELGRQGRRNGGLFPVVLALSPHPRLRAGMSVRVRLELPGEPLLMLPARAVLDPGGGRPRVYRLREGGTTVAETTVRPLRLYGERISVEGPLSAGDRIVVEGHGALVDGQAVQVVP